MKVQCPACARVYEIEPAQFPAKVKCEECGAKSLVEESGEIQVIEWQQPASSPPRKTAAAPKVIVKRGPSWAGVAVALVVFGGGLAALIPGLRNRASDPAESPAVAEASANPRKENPVREIPATPKPAPDAEAPPEPSPELTRTTPEAPPPAEPVPVAPAPAPADEEEPAVAETPATLEEIVPEVARAFRNSKDRMTAEPDKAESEVRVFLRGLFARVNGKPRAADLARNHPELLLDLLGDLWEGIEESPGARLPDATRISIRARAANRASDLTDTYVALLAPANPGEPATPEARAEISRSSDIGRLLQHFAEAEDSGTVDNALTFGRMVHAFRQGRTPLSDVSAAPAAIDPDSLPDVRKSVNLADFKSARELVRWAHEFNPSPKAKVKLSPGSEAEQILSRVRAYLALPPEVLLPHPGAADFPGAVTANAPRVERQVTVDLNRPRWQATGLYAPPGEPVTVAIPAGLRKLGLKLRIGAHTDNILRASGDSDSELSRFPILSSEFPLDEARVTVGNPFGGAIYIDVPHGKNGGDFQVPAHGWTIRPFEKIPPPDPKALAIAGAVEMPWWRPGMTGAAWREELKKPAPWAEMDFGALHACVPRADAAEARDPSDLTEFWQLVMDSQWEFAGYPGHRHIPMRVSFDRQISAGFMHSGYPIMVHVPQVGEVLDLKKLSSQGSWGMFHEIGHNHQPVCITPGGFVESTVNLFTLVSLKAILPKKDPIAGHGALSDPRDLLRRRRAGEEDPWINLSLFLPLIDEFGFDSLTRTLETYWEDARRNNGSINFSNEERQDQWVRRFGETVERDVSDYFESVFYKVSPATKKALSKFEVWKP